MIGRGTRVLEADPALRKAWCPEKDRCLVIDCWGNFDYFQMHPRGREPGEQVPMPVRLFWVRLDHLEVALANGAVQAVEAVKVDLRADLAGLPANNVIVLEQQADLARVRGDAFWARLGRTEIGFLRRTIAPIMRAQSDADFKTLRFQIDVIELGTALLTGHRDAAEAVRALVAENSVWQRLQTGAEVSTADLRELAELLRRQDPTIDEERLRRAYDVRTASFVQLIKHVLGVAPLERWSTYVTRKFDEFIAAHTTYTALQIRFLQTLRTFILQQRRLERRDLVDSPFTQLHPDGARGVFPARDIEEILGFAEGLVA